ncbi:OmpA family protein [Mucilaginibacter hurinus]|uniref:OmpA family protein n=1 Tax=Mucilaginibacter hurinus TaxID=2201324 RepID=A0A367GLM3_9SPHI|nr:OmpA family protein [Mucilaginibacter hurinus]RCH53756.1 OmpA family protein [Mucilaginibacter hurinus]
MSTFKSLSYLLVVSVGISTMSACKSKKAVVAPPPTPVKTKPVAPPSPTPVKAEPAVAQPVPPPPAPPNYNFSNILFEFNSGILKTESYPILDKAIVEMKKDPSVKFLLDGHSSAEGSEKHNMDLSVERANSVKLYLTNSGINGNNLMVKGFGESKPLSSGTDEASRAKNRRVEIKKQ